jgi:hypothetical protein
MLKDSHFRAKFNVFSHFQRSRFPLAVVGVVVLPIEEVFRPNLERLGVDFRC